MTNLKFFQSRDLKLYKPILEGLVDDLGFYFYQAILVWCGVITCDDYYKGYFWQMFLIERDGEIVGFFSLACQERGLPDDVWIEWLGVVPEFQNKGFGSDALKHIEYKAREFGFNRIFTYVEPKNNPLSFYNRNGYSVVCSVQEYLSSHPNLSVECFGDNSDLVVTKKL